MQATEYYGPVSGESICMTSRPLNALWILLFVIGLAPGIRAQDISLGQPAPGPGGQVPAALAPEGGAIVPGGQLHVLVSDVAQTLPRGRWKW